MGGSSRPRPEEAVPHTPVTVPVVVPTPSLGAPPLLPVAQSVRGSRLTQGVTPEPVLPEVDGSAPLRSPPPCTRPKGLGRERDGGGGRVSLSPVSHIGGWVGSEVIRRVGSPHSSLVREEFRVGEGEADLGLR